MNDTIFYEGVENLREFLELHLIERASDSAKVDVVGVVSENTVDSFLQDSAYRNGVIVLIDVGNNTAQRIGHNTSDAFRFNPTINIQIYAKLPQLESANRKLAMVLFTRIMKLINDVTFEGLGRVRLPDDFTFTPLTLINVYGEKIAWGFEFPVQGLLKLNISNIEETEI